MLHIWKDDHIFKERKFSRPRAYKKRDWSEDRIAFVTENYYKMTRKEIAEALGTTVYDVANIIFKIRKRGGLQERKSRRLTEEEISFIEENKDSMSIKKMADSLGRRHSVVSRYLSVRKDLSTNRD